MMAAPPGSVTAESASIVIENEFGSIELRLCRHGNGDEVVVTDRRSGASRTLDVLALEGLVWAPEWVMARLADPGLPERPGAGSGL